jgi:hypothetical protein
MFRYPDADRHDMSTAFLHRLLHRKPPAPSTLRMNVCPPDICVARDPLWLTAVRWLAGLDGEAATTRRTPLERARIEFTEALDGLLDLDTDDLLRRAQHARSLRELWHLRSELYTTIARRINQPEADTRLARVNLHFPTRTSRTTRLVQEAVDVQ